MWPKKIANMKRAYRLFKRPGASSKGWKWFNITDEIFGNDPTVQLDHVADVDDGGPKVKKSADHKVKPKVKSEKHWRREIIDIEKEWVEAFKSIAESQHKKNNTFDILTSAIIKMAEK